MAETSLGIQENIEALIAYLIGFVSGIALLILEKKNEFVRFHAAQSTVVFLGILVLQMVLGMTIILWLFSLVLSFVQMILWIVLMVKAFKGERYKLPVVGDWAEKLLEKIPNKA